MLLCAQVVSNQLCTVTQERDELAEQARLHSTRSAYHEQLVRARESDLQDIRTAYEVGERTRSLSCPALAP
jgi:hypothetical protein